MRKRLEAVEQRRQEAAKKIEAHLAEHGIDPAKAVESLDKSGASSTVSVRTALQTVFEELPRDIQQARATVAQTTEGISKSTIESFERGSIHDFDFHSRLEELPRQLDAAQRVAPENRELSE